MAYLVLVQFLSLLLHAATPGSEDRIFREVSLGEKPLENYAGRYDAFISQDIFSGRLTFKDDEEIQNYFNPYMFGDEKDYSRFFRSEINSALICTNDQFSRHYDDLRFSYRLITLSYLLEGQWHMKLTSEKLRLKNGCQFDTKRWLDKCEPKSDEMKKFVERLKRFDPVYNETLPLNYDLEAWNRELKAGLPIWYSQTRLKTPCRSGCDKPALENLFTKTCGQDEELMTLICSERDDLYGLSAQKDAYFLIAKSNIINTFNTDGEALGCLRRFSEVMAHRESHYPVLKNLFPTLESFLIEKYQERFMQGRIFFYGAAKEFEEKGLADVFTTSKKEEVKAAPIVLAEPKKKDEIKPEPPKPALKEPPRIVMDSPPPKKEVDTMKMKSAFLQAAEVRSTQNLNITEVDMTKLRYDYVFSLNMINTLSTKLKTFMTREALTDMLAYDQLGSKQGPVPLLFIKFLMDFQEHQGLWNLISVIGDKFYVSNDIDLKFKTQPELVQLKNDESTGRQWQIFILKP